MGLVMWTGGTATGAPEDEPSPVDKTNDQNQDRGVSDSTKETDQENSGSSEAAGRFNPVVRKMQGWTIYIEPALIDGKHGKRGRRALAMLRDHLRRIRVLMPDDRLKMLRQLDIWIEHNHPEFRSLQYHPKVNWLKKKRLRSPAGQKGAHPESKNAAVPTPDDQAPVGGAS